MVLINTSNLTPEQIEALEWALDLAFDDQHNYVREGDPAGDYGNDWPDARAMKAAYCRSLAELATCVGETNRWNNLADEIENIPTDEEDEAQAAEAAAAEAAL